MNLLHSNIAGLPVAAAEQRAKIGIVKDLVISPDDGAILGIIIGIGLMYLNPKIITWQDIRSLAKDGVVTSSSDDLLPMKEVIRIKNLLESHFNLIGLPVFTASDEKLGKVYDYTIETALGQLKSIICPGRIITKSKIIRIESKKIIVASGVKKIEPKIQLRAEPSVIQ